MEDLSVETAPRVGVSACLLGAPVRFDGGHKRNPFIDEQLRRYVDFVPFCPETEIGLSTPRQPIRLVSRAGVVRAVGSRDPALDVTAALQACAREAAGRLDDLCAFIFKKGSPSCGLQRVRVYPENGIARTDGTGLFAEQIMRAQPLLPVEEEGRLNDPVLRENFVARMFVYARWRATLKAGLSKSALLAFHARHKLQILAHGTVGYRQLGRLLADLKAAPLEALAARYIETLMRLLQQPATRRQHTNVLQHIAGYLRRDADTHYRSDLQSAIEGYRQHQFPLIVPVRLLQHQFQRHPHPYIEQQVYLRPYPQDLRLRNAI